MTAVISINVLEACTRYATPTPSPLYPVSHLYLLKLELRLPNASGLCLPPIKPAKSTLSLLTCLDPCVWLSADSGFAWGAVISWGAACTGAALWNGFAWPEKDSPSVPDGADGAWAPAPVCDMSRFGIVAERWGAACCC